MANPKFFTLLAGNPEAWEKEEAEKRVAFKERNPFLCGDDNLCHIQSDQARRGRLSARLIHSMRGWTVRYASGIQGFEIMFSSGDHNPAQAMSWGMKWANADPANREFYADNSDVEKHSLLEVVTA